MLENTEPVIETDYWQYSMKNQKNEKWCKSTLKILKAVG